MKYIDISPLISEQTAVFPGDTPFSRAVLADFKNGDNLQLSAITATLHIGAHADAPCHYDPKGQAIHQRTLAYYLGPCQVISVTTKHEDLRIHPKDIEHTDITAPRVLFKTLSYANSEKWNDDFVGLSPELVNHLASIKVVTVGIDTPSIDPATSKLLESHQAIKSHDMAILEGLVLNAVTDGEYQLVALPLKIKDADASPVRAVLIV